MDYFGQAKVADFHEAVVTAGAAGPAQPLHDENVGGLEIAMEYAGIMGRFNARHYLTENCYGALYVESAFAPQELVKALAVDVFHHQEKHAFRTLAEVRDVNHIGMTDGCRQREPLAQTARLLHPPAASRR